MLAPRRVGIAPEEQDELAAGGADSPEEGSVEPGTVQTYTMFPSAMGLTFAVDAEAVGLQVTARWGRYLREKRGEDGAEDAEETGAEQDGKKHWVWQRYPMEGIASLRPLEAGRIGPLILDAEQPEVTLQGSVRRNRDHWIITLFLVNGQEEPKKRKDQAWVFQPEIIVEGIGGAAVFCRKLTRDQGNSKLDPRTREEIESVEMLLLRGICEEASARWPEPDSGIWEVRGAPRHFVHSKIMCWVALDRGLEIAERYGFPADRERWRQARDAIRAAVLEHGWSAAKGAFVQAFGSEELDASALLLPLLGFLPFDDPRVASTVAAVKRELGERGFLLRYRSPDGIAGGEGVFLLCSFWYVDCLVGLGRLEEAERHLRQLEAAANHLGLFAEEHDPATGEALGNFPQAFTHIGYVNSVVRLAEARARAGEPPPPPRRTLLQRFFPPRRVLNTADGSVGGPGVPAAELAAGLKESMNVLRGAFFDTARGRVAYERMASSEAYADYLALARRLPGMDLDGLADRRERIAFWVNLFNVMVIHGVVALGIRDSVKEVRDFFGAVRYRIGPHVLSPTQIEHGILRGDRRPPHALRRLFGPRDPRRELRVDPPDPRTHFALVCASSSCPPIAVYTTAGLDEELDISARTFVNAGGVRLDRARGTVALSRVFAWYAGDFGDDAAAVLRFAAPYLYDEGERTFLLENADVLRVRYQNYDWRLNRAPGR